MDALFALPILAQADDGGGIIGLLMTCCFALVPLAFLGVIIGGMWKVFEKAGLEGWKALVPILNLWLLATEVAKKEPLWGILLIVPCTSPIGAIMVGIGVAEQFGKGTGFGIGLAFVPFICYPLLGFGDATYQGGAAAAGGGEFAV